MLSSDQFRLEVNRWLIKARWYYLAGALVLFAVIKLVGQPVVVMPLNLIILMFALAAAVNTFFFLNYRQIKEEIRTKEIGGLSLAQVLAEVAFFLLVVHLTQGIEGAAPTLLFIPIVSSAILLAGRQPLAVSISVSVLMLASVVGRHLGWLDFYGVTSKVFDQSRFLVDIGQVLFYGLAYLVVGLLATYVSRLIENRNRTLARQLEEDKLKIKDIERLNKELTDYAKELFDKDFELTLANKRLQTLEQAKSKFVSVTTHQLRTPLSAIKWTFHMLLQKSFGEINAEQRDFLKKGYDSTQRIIAIVNDLLNIDYIEANKLDYHFIPVKIEELVDGLIFEFANQAESKKIKLNFVKPSLSLPEVTADPIKISMVLENLIDNAIKYTPGEGRVTVSLDDARLNSAQKSVEVIVSDTGIGILAGEKDRISHRFFRGSNAIRREPDGTGLGLFIAKDIIEKHGGQLWFESKENEGSHFHFTLPVHRPADVVK